MKKITIILLPILFLITSCNDWLDVKPVTNVVEKDLYKTANGYRTVLNGLYMQMATQELYMMNLSFGMADVLSNQYTFDYTQTSYADFKALSKYDYNQEYAKRMIQSTWLKAYNVIANANNLIQNIDKKADDFFEYKEFEKKMIKGEALAIRALLHFDMLRLFAPAPVNDDGNAYVPYVENYPNIQPNGITVNECISKVITDLEEARELVMAYDTTGYGKAAVTSKKARFKNDFLYGSDLYNSEMDEFFTSRGFRLNYHSITALLARAYQYNKEYDKAREYAEEIINADWEISYYSGKYYTFDYYDVMRDEFESKTDLRLGSSLIFACYDEKTYESIAQYFRKDTYSGGLLFEVNMEGQRIFKNSKGDDESETDLRSKYLIYYANGGTTPVSGKWYIMEDDEANNNNVNILPVIRLTEMYYIAAESYARKSDWGKAKDLLTEVRTAVNCTEEITVTDWDSFVNELLTDARREWISEGQLFYLYKRLDAPIRFEEGKEPRPMKRQEYLVPIPSSQSL